MTIRITMTVLLLTGFITAGAQSWRTRQLYRAHPPKLILVQLFTYPRRVAYYTKHKEFDKLNNFNREAAAIAHNIVKDFNDNFDFCPVYYYYDTNAAYIRQGKFNNIVLDKDLNPVNDNVIRQADTNYFIVMNALLMSEDFMPGEMYPERESVFAARDNVNNSKARLVVLDHKFRQLPKSTVRTTSGPASPRKDRKAYQYTSGSFSLQYAGQASTLSRNFNEFFNPDF